MVNLGSLTEALDAPRSFYRPYARTIGLLSGTAVGQGWPVAVWEFTVMTPEQRNQLKAFCTGAAATVFVRTKLNDDTYADFSGVMIWPEEEERRWGLKFGLKVEIRRLVAL